jgi:hypothetical protein
MTGLFILLGIAQSTTIYVPDDHATIQAAIDASMNGDMVIVKPGTYNEVIDFKGKAITVKSEQGAASTNIDGEGLGGSVVSFTNGESFDSVLQGFTVSNGTGTIKGAHGIYSCYGGGIYCYESSPVIADNIICGNTEPEPGMFYYGYGGGIYCRGLPTIINNLIIGNDSDRGGGICCDGNYSPIITNNTICDNQFEAIYIKDSSPIVANNILWHVSPHSGPEITIEYYNNPCTLFISHSDVKGGQDGVYAEPGCSVVWGDGMIDADPLFMDLVNGDYHLSCYSPCIDVGDNSAPGILDEDLDGDIRVFDGDGDGLAVVDMGCDELIGLNVPSAYPTIQEAIHAASEGDIVLVAAGTYTETIDFLGKAILVLGSDGAEATIIDGNTAGSVVTFQSGEGPDSTLDGFTIMNGSGTYNGPYGYYGGGIYCIGSSPTIINNTITNNLIDGCGGGIYCSDSSPIIMYNILQRNEAGTGGGMCNLYGSSPMVTHCIFSENSTGDSGGGMTNSLSDPTVTDCIFSGNYVHLSGSGGDAIYGGGMDNWQSNPVVANCIFFKNYVHNETDHSAYGGGMHNEGSSPTITCCVFSENYALHTGGGWGTGVGGGISSWGNCNLTVTNCTIFGNSANYQGGGICGWYDSNLSVINTVLWKNDTGGEIYIGDWPSHPSTLTISHSDVKGGQASVYVGPGSTLDWGDGMIDADPLFLDPMNDDFHLTFGSPCIDAGWNDTPGLPLKDFEGDPRIFPGNGKGVRLVGSPPSEAFVDMGADEYCLLKKQMFTSR